MATFVACGIAVVVAFLAGLTDEPMQIIPIDALALAAAYGITLPPIRTSFSLGGLLEPASIYVAAMLVASGVYLLGMVSHLGLSTVA